MSTQTINPATGEVIQSYETLSHEKINHILLQVKNAQKIWRDCSFSERKEKMQAIARLLEKNKENYAALITTEMGKPITLARAEIEKCAWVCDYYANEAEKYLAQQEIQTNFFKSYVTYQPLGIVFAIMPWNFPFWQVFRFAAPNLMAGNAGVLAHAQIVTGCGLAIEKLFQDAGFPADIFRTVIIDHEAAKYVIAHEAVSAVTLTGSERAGRSVGAEAGQALKKVVLELGGSDPYIILADADLENAAENIVKSRMSNSGQVCIAAKRIIAEKSIHNALLARILEKLKKIHMGDPLHEETQLGPMARADLRDTVHNQVMLSIEKGAKLLCGGLIPPETKGFYYPPTVLTAVKPGMPAFDEEVFGPVIAMILANDEDHAISLANQSRFGLAGAVFTQDIEKGEKIARDKITVGTCCVNSLVSSDPRLAFGGIKASGYGRELGAEGIHEFTNIKTVCVARLQSPVKEMTS